MARISWFFPKFSLLILFFISSPLLAQNSLSLSSHIKYFEDVESKFDSKAVLKNSSNIQWIKNEQKTLNLGLKDSTIWLKIDFNKIKHNFRSKVFLELDYAVIDYLEIWIQYKNAETQHYSTGDKTNFSTKPVAHRNFVFPINLDQNPEKILIRAKTQGSLQLPLYLWSPADFWEKSSIDQTIWGILLGIVLVMFLYNLFIYFMVWDKSYIFYCSYIFAFGLFQFCYSGFLFEYIFPNTPNIPNFLLTMGAFFCVLFAIFFSRHYLKLDQYEGSKLLKFHKAIEKLLLVLIIPVLFLSYNIALKITLIALFSFVCLVFTEGIFSIRKGFKPAKIFLLGWISVIIGSLLFLLNKVGVLPQNSFTEYIFHCSCAIEVTILSMALASRIKLLQEESTRINKQNLELQKNLNQELSTNIELFSNLCHELNNPLNYVSLGLNGSQKELSQLKGLLEAIFQTAGDNPEAKRVKDFVLNQVNEIESSFITIHEGSQKSSRILDTLKGASNLHGEVFKSSSFDKVLKLSTERYLAKFSLIDQKKYQVSWDEESFQKLLYLGNPYLASLAISNLLLSQKLFFTQNGSSHIFCFRLIDANKRIIELSKENSRLKENYLNGLKAHENFKELELITGLFEKLKFKTKTHASSSILIELPKESEATI